MSDNANAREEALLSIADMTARSVKAQTKFSPGTAHHTLMENRIRALRVAAALVEHAMPECDGFCGISKEDLVNARAPIDSLIHKSEKAREKLAPEGWQHRMMLNNLKALYMASALLKNALLDKEES